MCSLLLPPPCLPGVTGPPAALPLGMLLDQRPGQYPGGAGEERKAGSPAHLCCRDRLVRTRAPEHLGGVGRWHGGQVDSQPGWKQSSCPLPIQVQSAYRHGRFQVETPLGVAGSPQGPAFWNRAPACRACLPSAGSILCPGSLCGQAPHLGTLSLPFTLLKS